MWTRDGIGLMDDKTIKVLVLAGYHSSRLLFPRSDMNQLKSNWNHVSENLKARG